MYTREEFENLINNSPIFDIDKQINRELYKSEKYVLLTLLTDYYRSYIFPHYPIDEYGYTLIVTATECLKYYDSTKGKFLHLFNSSFKRDLGIERAKKIIDEHRKGINLATYDEQMIIKITSLARSRNIDICDSAAQAKIATILNISVDKVTELIYINLNAVAVASTVTNEYGDEMELADLREDKEATAEDALIARESLSELIANIDDVFKTVQERQKRLLSLLLTTEIIKAIECDLKTADELLKACAFCNKEIFAWCTNYGNIPTSKQIGEICGVSEQSISRTYKNFKVKLKNKR